MFWLRKTKILDLLFTWLIKKIMNYFQDTFRRRLALIIVDLGLSLLSFGMATALRFGFDTKTNFPLHGLIRPLCLLLCFRALSYVIFKVGRGSWRHSSTFDLIAVIKAHSLSSLAVLATLGFFRLASFSRAVLIIEWAFSIILCGGARFFVRLFS